MSDKEQAIKYLAQIYQTAHSSRNMLTNQCLSVKVNNMWVWVVSIRSKSLDHEWCGWLHAVKKTRVHDTRHLGLQHVLCTLDLLVSEVAERCEVVTPHGLRDADGWVAETVADGYVCFLITCIQYLLGSDAVDNPVQVSCHWTHATSYLHITFSQIKGYLQRPLPPATLTGKPKACMLSPATFYCPNTG